MRVWSTEEIVRSERVQELRKLSIEVSLLLYVRPDALVALNGFDQVGTSSGVALPDLHAVISGCRTHKTNHVILIHNHPAINGQCNAYPSEKDIIATEQFKRALFANGIELVDHIIVAQDGSYFSLRAVNML